jgi:periplasmic divalent cation tolerance protein
MNAPRPEAGEPTRVVLITAPDRVSAEKLARALVERRICACCNLIGGVNSIFRWQGEVHSQEEILIIAKTTHGRQAQLERVLGELHPYEVPECVVIRPSFVTAGFSDWLEAQCGAPDCD